MFKSEQGIDTRNHSQNKTKSKTTESSFHLVPKEEKTSSIVGSGYGQKGVRAKSASGKNKEKVKLSTRLPVKIPPISQIPLTTFFKKENDETVVKKAPVLPSQVSFKIRNQMASFKLSRLL